MIINSPILIDKNLDHDSEKHIKNFIKSLQSIDLKKENININNIDILTNNEITFES
jgi:hypothetical protein